MLKVLVACAAFLISPAIALAASSCPQQLLDGRAPVLVNPKLVVETQEICYESYALLHSGITRTPLWSAEHLTRDRIEAAHHVRRVNEFHPDPHVPPSRRAELSDYARSGYERGHMAPSGTCRTPGRRRKAFRLRT